MFSRRLLTLIKRHEYSFFGGTTGWPEHVYDNADSGQYLRRGMRSQLCEEEKQVDLTIREDKSARSYAFRVTAEGHVEICNGAEE